MNDENNYTIMTLRESPRLAPKAAKWFHANWGIPEETYLDSIQQSIISSNAIPQWYLAISLDNSIIAGCGVIENDFHFRKDLSPNLCALYVEPLHRNKGIAKAMLDFVRNDMYEFGIKKLYLLTDHVNFYEKCGWDFYCVAHDDDGNEGRIYIADTREGQK